MYFWYTCIYIYTYVRPHAEFQTHQYTNAARRTLLGSIVGPWYCKIRGQGFEVLLFRVWDLWAPQTEV